jgi:hypothetical protein
VAEDLEPEEAQAILDFLSAGRRIKPARGRRADMELPVVPELLDEMQTLMLQARPWATHSELKRLAETWEAAGFSSQEARRWFAHGARPQGVSDAMAFKDAGMGVELAFARPTRHGLQLTQTFFDLVRDGELTVADVRRILNRDNEQQERRKSS